MAQAGECSDGPRTVFMSLIAAQNASLFGESVGWSLAATGMDLIELVVSFARHFEVCTLHPPTAVAASEWPMRAPVWPTRRVKDPASWNLLMFALKRKLDCRKRSGLIEFPAAQRTHNVSHSWALIMPQWQERERTKKQLIQDIKRGH